ncbi:hypothetical protein PGB90_007532 [Kerria lacca]
MICLINHDSYNYCVLVISRFFEIRMYFEFDTNLVVLTVLFDFDSVKITFCEYLFEYFFVKNIRIFIIVLDISFCFFYLS